MQSHVTEKLLCLLDRVFFQIESQKLCSGVKLRYWVENWLSGGLLLVFCHSLECWWGYCPWLNCFCWLLLSVNKHFKQFEHRSCPSNIQVVLCVCGWRIGYWCPCFCPAWLVLAGQFHCQTSAPSQLCIWCTSWAACIPGVCLICWGQLLRNLSRIGIGNAVVRFVRSFGSWLRYQQLIIGFNNKLASCSELAAHHPLLNLAPHDWYQCFAMITADCCQYIPVGLSYEVDRCPL